MFFKIILLTFLISFFNNAKVNSNQRFICSRADTNEVVNFYISDNKLFLSGLSISGTYSILTKSLSGILAINMSSIGDDSGIEVKVTETVRGFIKKSDLAKEKGEQKLERFAVGEKIDSIVNSYDIKNKILILSIKQKEIIEEKEALNKFGSSDSGASLGDILGEALDKSTSSKDEDDKKND